MNRHIVPLSGEIHATVTVPGSKSDSARALICAALANGTSELVGVSRSDDTELMIGALRSLGVTIETVELETLEGGGSSGVLAESSDRSADVRRGASERALRVPTERTLRVHGGEWTPNDDTTTTLSVGAAGTTARFLLPLLATTPGVDRVLTGDARLCERPFGDLFVALRSLGADLTELGAPGCLPVRVRGVALQGGKADVSGRTSSQFLSGLLLSASRFSDGLELRWTEARGSASYVDLTRHAIERFGGRIEVSDGAEPVFRVAGRPLVAQRVRIDGDASGASYFWSLAAVCGGTVTIENLRSHSVQGDVRYADLLERMGCKLTREHRGELQALSVKGPDDGLRAIEADLRELPDTAQTIAVVSAFARGTSRWTGLHSLPYKETDRLGALVSELSRLGITARATSDSIEVVGGRPGPGRIETHGDHRMAMAFAVAGARVPGVVIENSHVVTKSMPDFWALFSQIGVESHAGE